MYQTKEEAFTKRWCRLRVGNLRDTLHLNEVTLKQSLLPQSVFFLILFYLTESEPFMACDETWLVNLNFKLTSFEDEPKKTQKKSSHIRKEWTCPSGGGRGKMQRRSDSGGRSDRWTDTSLRERIIITGVEGEHGRMRANRTAWICVTEESGRGTDELRGRQETPSTHFSHRATFGWGGKEIHIYIYRFFFFLDGQHRTASCSFDTTTGAFAG